MEGDRDSRYSQERETAHRDRQLSPDQLAQAALASSPSVSCSIVSSTGSSAPES